MFTETEAYIARVLFWQVRVCGNNMAFAGRELEPGPGGDPMAATWMCDREQAPEPPRVLTLSSKQRGSLTMGSWFLLVLKFSFTLLDVTL